MKRSILAAAGLTAVALVVGASPAFAFDCIRVSSSQQGLMQSTKSGNWAYLTIDDLVQGAIESGDVPADAAPYIVNTWHSLGEPSYFAIGIGVAGAHGATESGRITDQSFYELAKNAPVKVMVNGTGVDHLDDAIMIVAGSCVPQA
jgi:hypothetical protein